MIPTRLHKLWDELLTSYWFVPVGMTLAAAVLGWSLCRLGPSADSYWFAFADRDGARSLLSTLAAASITISSLTFSIMIVALTLASSQFGPRLLYNFMRDRANQVALGAFVGVFAYCLVLLYSLDTGRDDGGVPRIAVAAAIAIAFVGVGTLIYFVHHVASSIQATSVVAGVSRELRQTIERVLPPDDGAHGPGAAPERPDPGDALLVRATRGGIVQAIDLPGLCAAAAARDLGIEALRRPGDYVIERSPLARVSPAAGGDEALPDEVRRCFLLGLRRTPIQDVEFAILQLVEVGLRALSPGINDPFTAMSCVDELGQALAALMQRGEPQRVARDADGRVRVWLDATTFAGMANAAFDQLRQHGAGHVAVALRMLEVLGELVRLATKEAHVEPLRRQAKALYDAARRDLAEIDAAALDRRHERFTADCEAFAAASVTRAQSSQ